MQLQLYASFVHCHFVNTTRNPAVAEKADSAAYDA